MGPLTVLMGLVCFPTKVWNGVRKKGSGHLGSTGVAMGEKLSKRAGAGMDSALEVDVKTGGQLRS